MIITLIKKIYIYIFGYKDRHTEGRQCEDTQQESHGKPEDCSDAYASPGTPKILCK